MAIELTLRMTGLLALVSGRRYEWDNDATVGEVTVACVNDGEHDPWLILTDNGKLTRREPLYRGRFTIGPSRPGGVRTAARFVDMKEGGGDPGVARVEYGNPKARSAVKQALSLSSRKVHALAILQNGTLSVDKFGAPRWRFAGHAIPGPRVRRQLAEVITLTATIETDYLDIKGKDWSRRVQLGAKNQKVEAWLVNLSDVSYDKLIKHMNSTKEEDKANYPESDTSFRAYYDLCRNPGGIKAKRIPFDPDHKTNQKSVSGPFCPPGLFE